MLIGTLGSCQEFFILLFAQNSSQLVLLPAVQLLARAARLLLKVVTNAVRAVLLAELLIVQLQSALVRVILAHA